MGIATIATALLLSTASAYADCDLDSLVGYTLFARKTVTGIY
jgi:hypothetical protein